MTNTSITRIRTLLMAEIKAYSAGQTLFLLLFVMVTAYTSRPGLGMLVAALVLSGGISIPTQAGNTIEFTVSMASSRREIFLAKTAFVVAVAPVLVAITLLFAHFAPAAALPPRFFPASINDQGLVYAFVRLLVLFLAFAYLFIFLRILTTGLPPQMLIGLLGGFMGVVMFQYMLRSFRNSTPWLPLVGVSYLAAAAAVCAWLAYLSLLCMEPGVGFLTSLRKKVSNRAEPVSAMCRETVSSIPKPAIIPAVSRPDTVRYVQPVVWLESMGLIRHILCMLMLTYFLLFAVVPAVTPEFLGQGIAFSLCALPMLACIGANPDTFSFGDKPAFPQQFLFALAVPRRVYFRVKIVFWTAVTFGLAMPIGLLCGRGVPEETTLPLPHRVAEMLNAQISTERLSALLAGVRLVPPGLYGNYTIPSSRAAYLLAVLCLLSIAYFSFWWPVTKSYMETPTRLYRIQTGSASSRLATRLSGLLSVLLLCVVAFGFSGIILSYTFAFAYTHPFYLIFATIAVCLVLEQIAERQFQNFEIVA